MATDPNDPLEKARFELARLKDADDWDEPTGRHEVSVTVNVPNPPAPSQPEITVEKETTKTEEKTTIVVVKQVSVLAKLLPEQHRLVFFIGVMFFGSILCALAKGWIHIGP